MYQIIQAILIEMSGIMCIILAIDLAVQKSIYCSITFTMQTRFQTGDRTAIHN